MSIVLDFGIIYVELAQNPTVIKDGFRLQDDYLFRANKLCALLLSVHDFLVWEIHVGGLSGHFGWDKSIEEVERQFC